MSSRMSRRMSTINGAVGAMSFAAAHLRANDIKHVNTGVKVLEVVHRVVYGPPALVLLFFLLVYVSAVCIFAVILLFHGEDCFRLDGSFNFAAMMWISVHSFSTIGFGNVSPTQSCTSAQLMVLLESFVSLLIHSAIGGYVVKLFMRPLSSVRFSKVVLVNHGRRRVEVKEEEEEAQAGESDDAGNGASDGKRDESPKAGRLSFSKEVEKQEAERAERKNSATGHSPVRRRTRKSSRGEAHRFITFRMVRQGSVQLRDVRVQMQAQYWVDGHTAFGDRDSHKGRVVNLGLEQNYFTTLEQLQVWHQINEISPLWRMRDSLDEHIGGLEVSVSAFDMASLQQVMFFKRYERNEILHDCVFENTLTPDERSGKSMLLADHSKLDGYTVEDSSIACNNAQFNKRGRRHRLSHDSGHVMDSLTSSFRRSRQHTADGIGGMLDAEFGDDRGTDGSDAPSNSSHGSYGSSCQAPSMRRARRGSGTALMSCRDMVMGRSRKRQSATNAAALDHAMPQAEAQVGPQVV